MNFNNFSLPPASWRHDWTPAAVLCVRGEDALAFLQGQFSQDLRPAGASQPATYGLLLNHKGRVLADSFALGVGPMEVWLVSYFSAAAVIRAHLESHIIADDVTVEDWTAAWRGVAVDSAQISDWCGAPLPTAGQFARADHGFVFRGRRGAGESWEWIGPVASPSPAAALPTAATPANISPDVLAQMRIAAGIPAVPTDIGPGDLPHEGGLDVAAVSYTKGCYLGQEVMARLRTGRIRRRLARVSGSGKPPPRDTDLIQTGKKVGELRSTVAHDAGGWHGLALLTLYQLDPALPLSLAPDAATEVSLLDRPD